MMLYAWIIKLQVVKAALYYGIDFKSVEIAAFLVQSVMLT